MNHVQYGCAFLILMVSLAFSNLNAANDTFKGYIILKNGKKIEGKIIAGNLIDNEVKITFFQKGKKTVYKPKDIKAYGYEEYKKNKGILSHQWKHYESHTVEEPPKIFGPTDVFIHLTVNGEIKLYSYYVEQRSNYDQPIKLHYFIKDKTGKFIKVERDGFHRLSKKIFTDYPALIDRLGKKMFEYESMDRMVRDYNFWLENKHPKEEYRVAPVYFGT